VFQAHQALIQQKASGANETYLTGDEAIRYGWNDLTCAVVAVALAWAVWFFWQ